MKRKVAASTQNQALSALLLLYKDVLKQPLDWLNDIERAKRGSRLPVVFTRSEARAILAQLDGSLWIMASLLYGSGLRLMECLRLRVKDIDFEYGRSQCATEKEPKTASQCCRHLGLRKALRQEINLCGQAG